MKLTIGELADMLENLQSVKDEWETACTRANSYSNADRRAGKAKETERAVNDHYARWLALREEVVFTTEIDEEDMI